MIFTLIWRFFVFTLFIFYNPSQGQVVVELKNEYKVEIQVIFPTTFISVHPYSCIRLTLISSRKVEKFPSIADFFLHFSSHDIRIFRSISSDHIHFDTFHFCFHFLLRDHRESAGFDFFCFCFLVIFLRALLFLLLN